MRGTRLALVQNPSKPVSLTAHFRVIDMMLKIGVKPEHVKIIVFLLILFVLNLFHIINMFYTTDSLTLSPTDVPYTPRSRKTTRHIRNNMTPGKPRPTSGPPVHSFDISKYGKFIE